jgi:hypothetical protein
MRVCGNMWNIANATALSVVMAERVIYHGMGAFRGCLAAPHHCPIAPTARSRLLQPQAPPRNSTNRVPAPPPSDAHAALPCNCAPRPPHRQRRRLTRGRLRSHQIDSSRETESRRSCSDALSLKASSAVVPSPRIKVPQQNSWHAEAWTWSTHLKSQE